MTGNDDTTTTTDDRERWNDRYRNGEEGGTPLMLGRHLHRFPRSGRALDIAGGPGQAGVILAARGLAVTVVDVSDVALELARQRADRSRVPLETVNADLTSQPLPAGPWEVITCFNYLDRTLFPAMVASLVSGGLLALSIATVSNLERHPRPSARFLLGDGELPSLLPGLTIELYDEGWGLDGRHTAELLGRKV
ncbi:MAG: class I SAM-dependent methyltransferase [Acidimicrobiales bacterium]